MSWALFLDDERVLTDEEYSRKNWVYARTFFEACNLVHRLGYPNFVSFDHDLGNGPTGKDFAAWLVEQHLTHKYIMPVDFRYRVHSQNPIGKSNIEGLLDPFIQLVQLQG